MGKEEEEALNGSRSDLKKKKKLLLFFCTILDYIFLSKTQSFSRVEAIIDLFFICIFF